LARGNPEMLENQDSQISLIHGLLVLVLIGSAFLFHRHIPTLRDFLRNSLIWVLLGLVLVAGYSYRKNLLDGWNRIMAELLPGRAITVAQKEVIIRARGELFIVDAMVEGAVVPLLFDTGASHVTLSRGDASRLGFDLNKLNFSILTKTANGLGQAAPIRIREIRVGDILVKNIDALIAKTPMDFSLLGAIFLEKLSYYSVTGSFLRMRK
jgi:aspartyl protease family protein